MKHHETLCKNLDKVPQTFCITMRPNVKLFFCFRPWGPFFQTTVMGAFLKGDGDPENRLERTPAPPTENSVVPTHKVPHPRCASLPLPMIEQPGEAILFS